MKNYKIYKNIMSNKPVFDINYLCSILQVLIPFYQYAWFKRKYEDWIGDLHGLVYNYEYLNGDELYSEISSKQSRAKP